MLERLQTLLNDRQAFMDYLGANLDLLLPNQARQGHLCQWVDDFIHPTTINITAETVEVEDADGNLFTVDLPDWARELQATCRLYRTPVLTGNAVLMALRVKEKSSH